MSEVRLPERVRALHVPGDEEFDNQKTKGSFQFDGQVFTYRCPCGCGSVGDLRAGLNEKPSSSPSWVFNGDYNHPTLHPSVHHIGHWHGWLKNGWWEQA